MPGGLPGRILKLRFDWYINSTTCTVSFSPPSCYKQTIHGTSNFVSVVRGNFAPRSKYTYTLTARILEITESGNLQVDERDVAIQVKSIFSALHIIVLPCIHWHVLLMTLPPPAVHDSSIYRWGNGAPMTQHADPWMVCWLLVMLLIGHVRHVNILTWLRGFRVKLLYLVFSLYLSLFWELRDKRNLKILQFWPESLGAMLEYWYIERGLIARESTNWRQFYMCLSWYW